MRSLLLLAFLVACTPEPPSGSPPPAPSPAPAAAPAPAAPVVSAATPAAAAVPDAVPAPTADLPRLVFFLNPGGAPCQMQERILQDMAAELEGKVEVVRRSVAVAADRPAFAEAGIRALPALVLYDASGRELARSTPGIQDADRIRALIASR